MRIALGSDEDTALPRAVLRYLHAGGHEVDLVGLSLPWPEVGRETAARTASGAADFGIVCCWTGTGVCMAANKVKGARAALCADAATAEGARRWNDANVLALSIRATSEAVAAEIVDAFLSGLADPAEAATVAAIE